MVQYRNMAPVFDVPVSHYMEKKNKKKQSKGKTVCSDVHFQLKP